MIGRLVALRYELTQELGSDAIFDTYKATDRSRSRNVKVRLIRPALASDPNFIHELQSVCEVHSNFSHHGLERVFEVREDEGAWIVVTDIEEGATLEDRLKRLTSFSVPSALSTAISIAEALEACHAAGMVHGDLSCRTIFTKQSDGVKLMQAGYWRAYSQSAFAARVMAPLMAPYLAPEIAEGSMPNEASDVYALGVVLFRLITGRYPFLGESPSAISQQHAAAIPPSLRKLNSSVPGPLDQIIQKCLAKNPAERYRNAKQLLSDLRLLQDALRFGRPLKWPLDSGADEQEPIVVSPVDRQARLKPALSAAEEGAEDKPVAAKAKGKGKKSREESDGVPLWLSIPGYLILVGAIVLIGMWAVFSVSAPPEKTVPNWVGLNIQEATAQATKLKLKLSVVQRASNKPTGVILETSPSPGARVREAFPVQVIVSAGSRFVTMPDLRGRTLDEARTLLAQLDLELSQDVEQVYERNLKQGQIAEQIPAPRTEIERKSRIRVKVNSGVPGTGAASGAAGTTEWHRFTLDIPLPDGDENVQVRVEMTDALGTVEVYNERHRAGRNLKLTVDGRGREVTFVTYINDEPWDQQVITVDEQTPPGDGRQPE